jgi:endonuclease YncB( thermonuclease family)
LLRLQDLLSELRRLRLPRDQPATDRQIEAIENLGLGSAPDNLSFAEAGAILTARNVAREVLNVLGSEARVTRVVRLQLEPCLILAILRDQEILSELTNRNKRRWTFCSKDHPPPSDHTRSVVFAETSRFLEAAPFTSHRVLKVTRSHLQSSLPPPAPRVAAGLTPKQQIAESSPPTQPAVVSPPPRQRGLLAFLISIFRSPFSDPSSRSQSDNQTAADGHPEVGASAIEDLRGRASVIDGDTIEIHGQRIRIWGIDAPEGGQLGIKAGRPWRCGHECAVALSDFLGSRIVECTPVAIDEYERMVGRCTVAGQDVGAWMVLNGWAVDFKQFSDGQYAALELEAKQERRGLWQGEFELPWKWRVRSRWLLENLAVSPSEQSSP